MGYRTDIGSYLGQGIALTSTSATYSRNWVSSRAASEILNDPMEFVQFAGTIATTTLEVSAGTWVETSQYDSVTVHLESDNINSTNWSTVRLYATVDSTVDPILTVPEFTPSDDRTSVAILTNIISAGTTFSNSDPNVHAFDSYNLRGVKWIAPTIENTIASESTTIDFTVTLLFHRRI